MSFPKDVMMIVDEPNATESFVLELKQFRFGLKWYDHGLRTPGILEIQRFNLWVVGVGSTVVAISKETGIVKFCMGLIDPFSFLLEYDFGFMIVSETTITSVSGENYAVSRLLSVPEIIVDVKLEGGKIFVECLGKDYIL
jgi:hypothetical protein